MHIAGLNRRRSRTLLLAIGQLVLLAYVFQMGAFDHWAVSPGHTHLTTAGSATHAEHCHGDAAGCADASGGFATMTPDAFVRLPQPPSLVAIEAEPIAMTPLNAFVPTPSEPPRAS